MGWGIWTPIFHNTWCFERELQIYVGNLTWLKRQNPNSRGYAGGGRMPRFQFDSLIIYIYCNLYTSYIYTYLHLDCTNNKSTVFNEICGAQMLLTVLRSK
jgi:hypothetical protein